MKDAFDSSNQGMVSQWNEGDLKSLRLHEAQELINNSKIEPFKKIGKRRYNYLNWIEGCSVLYGEGKSKYADNERKEIEEIKTLIYKKIIISPIIMRVKVINGFENKEREMINYKNWESLRKLIELYEQRVKLFNDKHGLSTRNYNEMDDGL